MFINTNNRSTAGNLKPVSSSERIQVMDVLRGFTLIGILLMNIEWFNRPVLEITQFDFTLSSSDHAVSWFIKCFIEGKFYRLFALLFGMGFAVMLIRARESGLPFSAMFMRRMLALLIFGVLHLSLLWKADILHDYAIAGMMLLAWVMLLGRERFNKFDKPGTFLKVGLSMLLFPNLVLIIFGVWTGMTHDTDKLNASWLERQEIVVLSEQLLEADQLNAASGSEEGSQSSELDQKDDDNEDRDVERMSKEERIQYLAEKRFTAKKEHQQKLEEEISAMTDHRYWPNAMYRLKQVPKSLAIAFFFCLIVLIPIFMLGYWLICSGKLKNAQAQIGFFKALAWVGVIGGCALSIGPLLIILHPAVEHNQLIQTAGGSLFFLGQNVLAAGYLGLIVCMFCSPRWQPRLNILAPLGRMALTNYIMQSLILSVIFYGYAGGMFGQISRAPQMLIVFAIIVFQLVFCKWWLSKYRYGPLEWVWRCITYKQYQPLRLPVGA